ncbi:PQQ-binding-like beta-propeller repeat protein, partial [Candidatus Bathyarchaeota archaeon]|nr:PQQ-binding-like beta-propeller repeat protein [Candidatus Bathyarchaeota archaeon]
AGWYWQSSPTVAYDMVFIGNNDSRVYALNQYTGIHVWNYTTSVSVLSSPAVVDGKVYVGSDGVYCLNAFTGEYIWSYSTGDWVVSSPTIADGKVYVGSLDNKVYCLDASTGANIWNYTTGGDVQSSPAVADGRVYVGSAGKSIYCLNASTGAYMWEYLTGDSVVSSPAVADGKVYVGSKDNKVYCLDATTGAHIWSYTTGDCVESSPTVADGMVFVGSYDHGVYAFGCVIRVPEDYPTVQEAIDAAEGTIILIAPGVYHENLVINKTLTILGRTGSSPVFDGGGSGIAVILLPGASGSTVTNIVITNYDQGILVIDSNDCKIYNNIMSRMVYSGIALEGPNAKNNLIYSNIFENNPAAINITESATGNTIYNNTISLNTIGLNLESSGNTIYANTITENEVGINMTNSDGNTIYHNSFVNNDVQAVSETSLNTWDSGYPDGGNFWSDFKERYADVEDIYSGQHQDETGSDGIWDIPYVIDENNQDNYPLTKPYG